jgi:hypothetical protein
MIFIHIIYIPFYYLLRPLKHTYFDSESAALAVISFLFGFTTTMIYDFTIADHFSRKARGVEIAASIMISATFLFYKYWKKDIPKDIVKKYKNTLVLGIIIDGLWTALVIYYLKTSFLIL